MKSNYLNADDVATILNVSKPFAYSIIQKWNKELESKGYLVIRGKIPKKFFMERVYLDEISIAG